MLQQLDENSLKDLRDVYQESLTDRRESFEVLTRHVNAVRDKALKANNLDLYLDILLDWRAEKKIHEVKMKEIQDKIDEIERALADKRRNK